MPKQDEHIENSLYTGRNGQISVNSSTSVLMILVKQRQGTKCCTALGKNLDRGSAANNAPDSL